MKELIGKYVVSFYQDHNVLHEIIEDHEKIIDGLWSAKPFKHVTPIYLNELLIAKHKDSFPEGASLIVSNKIDEYVINSGRYLPILKKAIAHESKVESALVARKEEPSN